jgi:hypothetical protein
MHLNRAEKILCKALLGPALHFLCSKHSKNYYDFYLQICMYSQHYLRFPFKPSTKRKPYLHAHVQFFGRLKMTRSDFKVEEKRRSKKLQSSGIHTYMHTYLHLIIDLFKYTYMHTCIHTYMFYVCKRLQRWSDVFILAPKFLIHFFTSLGGITYRPFLSKGAKFSGW